MEEDRVVYDGDIPEDAEGDMEHDHYEDPRDYDADAAEDNASRLEEMRKRLKEVEEEAAALREMQAKVESEMGTARGQGNATVSHESGEDADSRSVFVGNVDYSCTSEEVRLHFQSCGTVNRVTIKSDRYGHPKGYAYVEFLEPEAVQNAVSLNGSELHGRRLKVDYKQNYGQHIMLTKLCIVGLE